MVSVVGDGATLRLRPQPVCIRLILEVPDTHDGSSENRTDTPCPERLISSASTYGLWCLLTSVHICISFLHYIYVQIANFFEQFEIIAQVYYNND